MNNYSNNITDIINNNVRVNSLILKNPELITNIKKATEKIITCFNKKGKVLFCGNGGSAADAQHIASELSGRFYLDSPPLPAEAVHVNTSFITAVANDYSYNDTFARYIKAFANKNDVVFCISTSGNSKNVVNAIIQAKKSNSFTIAMTGKTGGKLKKYADILINVPSEITPRIQESHILIGHIICELVEKELFGKN